MLQWASTLMNPSCATHWGETILVVHFVFDLKLMVMFSSDFYMVCFYFNVRSQVRSYLCAGHLKYSKICLQWFGMCLECNIIDNYTLVKSCGYQIM